MDIEKIEGIVAKLAKNGDRETLMLVSDLLGEISKFKKKGENSALREMVENVRDVNEVDSKSHASLILEGLPDKPVAPLAPTPAGVKADPSTSDMMAHASLLF